MQREWPPRHYAGDVTKTPTPQATQTTNLLVGLAAAVVVLFGVWIARGVVGPLALGVVIVMICHPLRKPLERWGVPRWIATTVVILGGYAVLASMAALLYYAGAEFVALVRESAAEFQATVTEIMHMLQDLGLEKQASDALVSVLRPEALIGYVSDLSGAMIGVLTAFFFVLAYVVFIAIDGARYSRATAQFGARIAPTMERFSNYARSVRRYYVVNASFGLLVAVIDGLALSALGVPAPLVWAILAFVTNFIPNVGFVLGLVPPALVAFAVGGWSLMLIVIAIYCVVNVVLQVMVQPKFVADAVDLSLTLSFFSVIFWTLVIGPLGAILSIPLTLLVRALLFEGDPKQWWIRWLSGDDSVRPV